MSQYVCAAHIHHTLLLLFTLFSGEELSKSPFRKYTYISHGVKQSGSCQAYALVEGQVFSVIIHVLCLCEGITCEKLREATDHV